MPKNRANRILLLASCLFIAALILKIKYPGVYTEGFLFYVEAALVGGIADWFAVTALFKRPLGIPWHTAILPRRRHTFTEATIKLVQRKFFTKKVIFEKAAQLNAPDKIIDWLDDEARKKIFSEKLLNLLSEKAKSLDTDALSGQLTVYASAQGTFIEQYCTKFLRESGWQQTVIKKITALLQNKFSQEESRKDIIALLEKFENAKLKSKSSFLFSLGGMLDVINNEECAELIQKELLVLAQQLADEESSAYKNLLAILTGAAETLTALPVCQEAARALSKKLLSSGVIIELIQFCLANGMAKIRAAAEKETQKQQLNTLFIAEFTRIFAFMRQNEVKELLEKLLNDILRRSALQAQTMVGDIVRRALNSMTDEQLVRIVHSKMDTDLTWIRMNGSIVGGGIGLLLFIIMQLFK